MDNEHPSTFEEALPILDEMLKMRRGRWLLSAIPSFDFEDVSQIVRIHIAKKFDQYDQTQNFRPWASVIIGSQIRNILRNIYSNFSRPCLRCPFNTGNDNCSATVSGLQCDECPMYKKWTKSKKNAHDIKLALSMENHEQEVSNRHDEFYDTEKNIKKLNVILKRELKPNEWQIYSLLYIENKSEEETALAMGFKNIDGKRSQGYRRLHQIRTTIIDKTKKILAEGLD